CRPFGPQVYCNDVQPRSYSRGYLRAIHHHSHLLIVFAARSCWSLAGWPAPGVEIVVIQGRVEDQEKAPLRLVPPHGIIGEHQDVTITYRDVDNGRSVGQFRPTG